ncbi:MAG TPA: ATP-binding protein [Spirochaetota bacterium]|nr:ATP-binding protein [Spirochaetota bacterium]
MLITISSMLKNYGIATYVSSIFIYTGMIAFPFTFAFLALDYYPVKNKQFILKTIIITAPVLLLFFIIPERRYPLICLLHMAIYTHLLLSLKGKLFIKLHLTFIMLVPLLYLFFHYLFIHNDALLIYSILIVYIITFFMVLFEYSREFLIFQGRMTNLIITNNKLNQSITRLKQNNDLLKKIITRKDIELLQVARHASLAEVTTGIAHELAQPLTGIKCISQSIIDDINLDELDRMQAVADLAKISSLVDRSSSIIDHIRTFSRKRGFSFQKIDINLCLLNAIDLINNQVKSSDTEIVFNLDDSIPMILGDNLSLEQLFINLILNSRDAINLKMESSADFQGCIKIHTSYNESAVILTIEDNGCGIPQDILSRIWTPFFTTKQKGKGTGIGLSLSHRIIKEHGAEVNIESSDQGTTFLITFSLYREYEKSKCN